MGDLSWAKRIEVVSTGNELLDGTIADTNSKRLAEALRPWGYRLGRVVIVPDDPEEIRRALTEAAVRAPTVVVSGGLGPTSDDLTLEIAAKTFGHRLVRSEIAWKNIVDRLSRVNRPINPSQEKQAFVPEGSLVLPNEEGTAAGIQWEMGDRTFFFLPGVPREYDHLLHKYLVPHFSSRALPEDRGEFVFVLKTFGWPESALNELMKSFQIPPGFSIGYRTHLPENHLKIQVEASTEAEAKKLSEPLISELRKKLGSHLFSEDQKTFEESIVDQLLRKNLKIAVAESCTGGLVSSMITKVSGSSKIFERGFVTYSNEAKSDLLDVKKSTIEKFGAVSEEVVREMAEGALEKTKALGVQAAISISGVAGPTGGTAEKPVGTVWMAIASSQKTQAKVLKLGFDRELNQKFSAYAALQFLKDEVLGA